MQKIVFDSSAFLNRFFFDDIKEVWTTNSVLNEIKNREQKAQVENLIQQRKVKIDEPLEKTFKEIKKKYGKARLSETDFEVIALAKDLDAELHTDDYTMRSVANLLGIKIKGVSLEIPQKNFYQNILAKIMPTKEELSEIKKVEAKIIPKITNASKKLKLPLKTVLLAGSSARGTFIRNKKDLDFFLLFDLKLSVEEIKEQNRKILEEAFPKTDFIEEYGEHPYLKTQLFGVNIDFVPGFFITNISQRKSSVDRTPLHLEYLEKYQTKEHIKETILLKQFLKNNLLYGADQKNNGLPGYLVELFILKFNIFENVLKIISKFPATHPITIANETKIKRFHEPFVFVDPTDPDRNVASAVSKKNWQIFAFLANKYLKNKSEDFFFENIYANYAKITRNTLVLKLSSQKEKTEDTKWGIAKSLLKHCVNELNNRHFNVKTSSSVLYKDFVYLLFTTEYNSIIRGPPVNDPKNAKAFKLKHKDAYEHNGWFYSTKKFTESSFISQVKKTIRQQNPNLKNIVSENLNKCYFDEETNKRILKDFFTE